MMTRTVPSAAYPAPSMAAAILLRAIAAYQRWLSPHKGFACAYRVRHGGTGCSGYARAAIRAEGLAGIGAVRARLAACKRAAAETAATADGPDEAEAGDQSAKREKTRWYEHLDCSPDCGSLFAFLPFGRAGRAARGGRSGDGDMCGGCDVGPCDLSF